MMHWHVPMQHKKWVCSGLLLLALLIIGAPCVTGCADTVEKAVIGVIVVTHGAPISQWNDTVRGMKHQIKSPYSVEPHFWILTRSEPWLKPSDGLKIRGLMKF